MTKTSTETVAPDLRKSVRKVLLSKAIFISLDVSSKSALTIDLSEGGLSLTLPAPMEIGQACAISFDAPIQENKQRTLARGSVVSCIPKGKVSFRVGIHFIQSDPVSKQLIKDAVTSYLAVTA